MKHTYDKTNIDSTKWVIVEQGRDYKRPSRAVTFAFDTETQTYFDGIKRKPSELKALTEGLKDDEKRRRLSNIVWSWQCYDETNGFFMTNDFETFLTYVCQASMKFGWCYNATFDFSQIDYMILSSPKWHPREKAKKGEGYSKGQPWAFESVHNDMGARYAYKLWVPYWHRNRHEYVHSFEVRDLMKFIGGGLKKLLKDLDVRNAEGEPIRKLEMGYQDVDPDNLSQEEIEYCRNDVEGLYFAVKAFNETIERQSDGESHIFGKETNLMTAGGFAKAELLRSLYPEGKDKKARLKLYQKDHPMTKELDEYYRQNKLYRGGISFVNPRYKGKLLSEQNMGRKMNRYDVNSEYPFAMYSIRDLVGQPKLISMSDYRKMTNKDEYEAIYILNSISGSVKPGMLPFWYDPYRYDYVENIDEERTHLIFERELIEMSNWYDLEYSCEQVILYKKGGYAYRPFVASNYETKAQAKKAKNATLEQVAKLLLNSSYGKLSERLERVKGHYEINEATGAVHFVRDETEVDIKTAMSVAVGSLITAFARVYILSKIREICGDNVAEKFVYIDTDSIHAFADYEKADAFALGGLKLEAECEAVKYIAPKTYVDIEHINEDGTIDEKQIEIHSKGVNRAAIYAELKGKPMTLSTIDDLISYGKKYTCLVAMNVIGGKVLLPTEKYLARLEQAPDYDSQLSFNNMNGGIFTER